MGKDAVVLTIAFCAATVFITVMFRGRRKCSQCGSVHHVLFFWRKGGPCGNCQARSGRLSVEEKVKVWGYLAGCVLIIFSLALDSMEAKFGLTWGICLLGLFCIAAIFTLLTIADAGWRRWLLALAVRLARAFEAVDLRAARRAAGLSGTVTQEDGYTLWTDLPASQASAVRDAVKSARAQALALTGGVATWRGHVRVLCFAKHQACRAYTERIAPGYGFVAGYFLPGFPRRIVLCAEWQKLSPDYLAYITAHEAAHHLLWSRVRREAWLQEGLATISAGVTLRFGEPHAAARTLRAAKARGEIGGADGLCQASSVAFRVDVVRGPDPRALDRMRSFYLQSAHFLLFLRSADEERFRRFILSRWAPLGRERLFRQCFGMGSREAVARWRDTIGAQEIPTHAPVPEEVRRCIETEIAPAIKDRTSPRMLRTRGILALVSAGYLCRLDALIDVIEEDDEALRELAIHALQNITGETGRSTAEEWRAWWQSTGNAAPG